MLTTKNVKKGLGVAVLCAGLAALPVVVLAATNVPAEISTAAEHAGFSAKSKTLRVAHMHLHHVLNCLEGPDGKWFDAHALNPCKALGNGAIPDSKGNAKQMKMLEQVAMRAHRGLMSKSLKTVHRDAMMVQHELKKMAQPD